MKKKLSREKVISLLSAEMASQMTHTDLMTVMEKGLDGLNNKSDEELEVLINVICGMDVEIHNVLHEDSLVAQRNIEDLLLSSREEISRILSRDNPEERIEHETIIKRFIEKVLSQL